MSDVLSANRAAKKFDELSNTLNDILNKVETLKYESNNCFSGSSASQFCVELEKRTSEIVDLKKKSYSIASSLRKAARDIREEEAAERRERH